MTDTRYKKGERPKARVIDAPSGTAWADLWEVTRRNGTTTYMRHPYLVGEVGYPNDRVEIVEPVLKQYVVTYTSMVIEAESEEDAIARADEGGGGNWEAVEYVPETLESLCERLGVQIQHREGPLWPKGKIAVYYRAASAIGNGWVDATDLTKIAEYIERARRNGDTPYVKGDYPR